MSKDGEDHINIYSKGETSLGRYLSNFTYSPFKCPYEGDFKSIEGYWYYDLTANESLREKWGYDAKKYGQSLKDKEFNDEWSVDKRGIKIAILCKLTQGDCKQLTDFTNSTLPFRHYYKFGDKVVEPENGKWLVEYFEELRRILK